MSHRVAPAAVLLLVCACSEPKAVPPTTAGPSTSDPTTSTTSGTTTSATTAATDAAVTTPSTTAATGTPPAGFPPLGDACTVAADCGIVHRDRQCCYVCGGMYGNTKWVADVEAYCSGPGANAKCPPVNACERETEGPALGYAMASPKCTAGRCSDK
jgi:hypothetical protein